jgi:hypothetical protein
MPSTSAQRASEGSLALKRAAPALACAVFILLIGLMADSVSTQAREFTWNLKTLLFPAAGLVLIAAVTLLGLAVILRHEDERYMSRTALVIVLFSLMCRVIWVSVFDSYQVNDFGFYLNCGADVAVSGKPSESPYCGPENGYVYWKRSAFYTYPIALLFGKSLLAIKLINVLLATLTAWFFFQAGKIIFGARVSALGLLFFIWHPELWYAMTLASHDIPGLFWLSVYFYISALLRSRLLSSARSFWSLARLALCLGGAIFFLEVARSYHYGAILALTILTLIHVVLILKAREGQMNDVATHLRRRCGDRITTGARLKVAALHFCVLLAIPLLSYQAASRTFWHTLGAHSKADDGGFTCYLSAMDSLGRGRYEEIDNWLMQCPLVASGDRTAFAIRKVLHDVTHDPREFLRYLVRKNRILSRADDYLYWSSYTEHESWDTTYGQVRRINETRLDEQDLLIFLGHSAMLLMVIWRLLLYPAVRFRLAEAIPLLFSATYSVMFLSLLEAQSRYELFLVFVFSWMAAQAVLDLERRWKGRASSEPARAGRSYVLIYGGGALALALAACLFWGVSQVLADSYLTLRDQTGFAQVPQQELIPDVAGSPQVSPVFIRNNHKQLMLAYPIGISVETGSIAAVQRTFEIRRRSGHHLRFFLSINSTREEPFDQMVPWDGASIEYLVAANGQVIAKGLLKDIDDNKYFSFINGQGLEFGSAMTIQLVLRNVTRIDRVDPNRAPIMSLEYIDLQ